MSEVSARDVAALRAATGAGMMDCKRALTEAGGDLAAATTWLREQGLAAAGKRAGREASDGAVEVVVEDGAGVVVEVNCETDFVAKGEDFVGFVAGLARLALEGGGDVADFAGRPHDAGGTVEDAVKAFGAKVGENVSLGRVVRVEAGGDGIVDGYKHVQNGRGVIGVLVGLGGVAPSDEKARQRAHDLSLHIASAAPRWLSREDVPADVVAGEREILEKLTRNEGKPEQAVPKIVEGRLGGFFKDNVLVEQGFVRDPKRTISSLVEELGAGAQIRSFARVKVGEG